MIEIELRRQAVERAYRDHAPDVYRVAFAIVRDEDAAMDIAQCPWPCESPHWWP